MTTSSALRTAVTAALVVGTGLASAACGASVKYLDFPVQEGNRQVMARKFYNDGFMSPTDQAPTERAYQAAKNGDLKEAIRLGHEATQAKPKDAVAHYDLGILLEANHQWKDAEVEMEIAKDLDPSSLTYQDEIAYINSHKYHLSIYSATYQGELADHLPMTLVALAALGATSAERDAFASGYAKRLEPLGDAERGKRAAITAEIAKEGRNGVIARHVAANVDSIASLAFHALIRLAYAIDRDDDEEIAAALAAWESFPVALLPAAALVDKSTNGNPGDALVALAKAVKPVQRVPGTLITDAMAARAASEGFAAAIAAYVPRVDDLPALARTVAGIFATSGAFTALHMMTATHALRIVLPRLAPKDQMSIVRAAWIALGASFLTLGEVDVLDDAAIASLGSSEKTEWADLYVLARAQDDEHVIKAIYTAAREEATYGDRIFRHAAHAYARSR